MRWDSCQQSVVIGIASLGKLLAGFSAVGSSASSRVPGACMPVLVT
jgi:hypothetical protein